MTHFVTRPQLVAARLACALALGAIVTLHPAVPSAADGILARSRAKYASLRSYADTGTSTTEASVGGAAVPEHHAFTTMYRAPRHFLFDFKQDHKIGLGRFVIWGDAEAFHTWWATTGVEDTYPVGTGSSAFAIGSGVTSGALMVIAPLLFSQAGLAGAITEFDEATVTLAGTESVGGNPCHKLTSISRSTYGATGHVTNVRKSAIWIDTETLLIRKVFEDTPRGSPAGTILRSTITLEPQANPSLDDSRFKFTAPEPKP